MGFSSQPTLMQLTLRKFDHALWANLIWINLLELFKLPFAYEVMQGIVQKQEMILKMYHCDFTNSGLDLSERTINNIEGWKTFLSTQDLMREVDYNDPLEMENESYHLYQIAHNVCLHGTHQRGMLNLLAMQEGWHEKTIPNTGPLAFERHMKHLAKIIHINPIA